MKQQGFTLIEIMIAMAIIGILSAIAIGQYQNYVIKSQITSAIAELNGARPQYELIMNGGSASDSSTFTVDNMFFSTFSEFCIYSVYEPVSGVASPALECKLKKVSKNIENQSVFFNRDVNGTWTCSTSAGINNKFKPVNCI